MGQLSVAASQWASTSKRGSKEWDAGVSVHALLSWVATGLGARGLYAIYQSKEASSRPHLSTNHALVGVAAAALWLPNLPFGAAIKVSPKLYAKLVKNHRAFGYVALLTAAAAHAVAVVRGYVSKSETVQAALLASLALQAALLARSAAPRFAQLLAKPAKKTA